MRCQLFKRLGNVALCHCSGFICVQYTVQSVLVTLAITVTLVAMFAGGIPLREAWASVPGMFCLCHRTYVYIVGIWMDVKTEAFTVYMIYLEFALCLMSFYDTQV